METRTRTSWPSVSLVPAAESLEPDVPETVCDTIKKLDCKDIPKLSECLLSVSSKTSSLSVHDTVRMLTSHPNSGGQVQHPPDAQHAGCT